MSGHFPAQTLDSTHQKDPGLLGAAWTEVRGRGLGHFSGLFIHPLVPQIFAEHPLCAGHDLGAGTDRQKALPSQRGQSPCLNSNQCCTVHKKQGGCGEGCRGGGRKTPSQWGRDELEGTEGQLHDRGRAFPAEGRASGLVGEAQCGAGSSSHGTGCGFDAKCDAKSLEGLEGGDTASFGLPSNVLCRHGTAPPGTAAEAETGELPCPRQSHHQHGAAA